MTTAIFFTAAASVVCAFCVLIIAASIKQLCYWKLVRIFYKEHREEWLQEGKPDHVLLEGSMTGGRFRGGQYLFSKWLYSPPAWISASKELGHIHKRMCFWDRISKRIIIALILALLLAVNSLFFVFGRMKNSEQVVAPNRSLPPSLESTPPVRGSED